MNAHWFYLSSNLEGKKHVFIKQTNGFTLKTNDFSYTEFIKRQSIINVKGSEPVTVELLWTENGPVLDGSLYNLASITPEKHVTSVAWTLLSSSDTSFEAAFDIMTAASVQEAL